MTISIYSVSSKTFGNREVFSVFSSHQNANKYVNSLPDKSNIDIISETLKDQASIKENTVYIASYTTSDDLGQHIGIFADYYNAQNHCNKFYSKEKFEIKNLIIDDRV